MPYIPAPGPNAYDESVRLVTEGYERYIGKGDSWAYQATSLVNQLANYNVQPIQFGFTFDLANIEQAFDKPVAPSEPAIPGISTLVPDMPALAELVLKSAGDPPPDLDLSGLLAYTAPDAPNSPLPQEPETNVQLIPIEVEGRGTINIPVPPTLEQLGVVPFPSINMPTFQGQRPNVSIQVPSDGQIAFAELEYTPELAEGIRSALASMLQGGTGLPLHVEQAIFDRGRAREDRATLKAVQEVDEDMSTRNLVEPNGVLPRRLREVRTDARDRVSALNRDLTIRVAEIGIENIRQAVSPAIAWEQVLIAKVEAVNQRSFQMAIYARDYGLKRVDALVAIGNLQQQAYATDAAVFRELIAAELSKLQELEGRIKLEQLKGAVNENLIREYEAQWKGVQAMADFYKTDVEAAKVKGEINIQRIQQAELDVRKYVASVEGYGKVWDAHRAQVDASLAPLRAAEIITGAYGKRVDAHRSLVESTIAENRIQIDANGQTIDLTRLALQRAEQQRLVEVAAVDAILRRWSSATDLFQAKGVVAQAESASRDRIVALAIEQNRTAAQFAGQENERALQQMLKIAELRERGLEAAAQALTQLTASSQSAIGLTASIGARNDGSVNFNYQGEIN